MAVTDAWETFTKESSLTLPELPVMSKTLSWATSGASVEMPEIFKVSWNFAPIGNICLKPHYIHYIQIHIAGPKTFNTI